MTYTIRTFFKLFNYMQAVKIEAVIALYTSTPADLQKCINRADINPAFFKCGYIKADPVKVSIGLKADILQRNACVITFRVLDNCRKYIPFCCIFRTDGELKSGVG